VFYDALGGGNEKYVAEAISHEAGHNVGLHHDGTSTTGYYSGHGTGGHRLGADHGRWLLQGTRAVEQGRVPECETTRKTITRSWRRTAWPRRADDHRHATGTASRIADDAQTSVTTIEGGGIIERSGDIACSPSSPAEAQ